jgi:hypothetical protein
MIAVAAVVAVAMGVSAVGAGARARPCAVPHGGLVIVQGRVAVVYVIADLTVYGCWDGNGHVTLLSPNYTGYQANSGFALLVS